jgi:hypothetical protein
MMDRGKSAQDADFFSVPLAQWVIGVLSMLIGVVGKESLLGLILRQTRSEIASFVRDEQGSPEFSRDELVQQQLMDRLRLLGSHERPQPTASGATTVCSMANCNQTMAIRASPFRFGLLRRHPSHRAIRSTLQEFEFDPPTGSLDPEPSFNGALPRLIRHLPSATMTRLGYSI